MAQLTIYVAGSFKHKHGVRLLGRELRGMGCRMLDWTDKAVPPPGLTPAERRIWMDTDRDGGEVYAFCHDACLTADMVIYYGASGQDAGGGVTAASEGLLDWLARVAPDAESVGLLGFSQGGAIALQTLRLAPERIAFAVVLAGFVADGELPTDAALAAVRPPVFWGRGARDEVIPAARVARTTEWLPRFVELSGRVYPGLTHSVSEEELGDVRAFLQKRLDDLAS